MGTTVKASALRSSNRADLEAKVKELHVELFNLRFRNSMKQVEDPVKLRRVRREIARILTVINEDKQGIRSLGQAAK